MLLAPVLRYAASFHHDLCAGNVLLGKSVEELAALSVSLGQPRYRGKQIFDGLLQGARSTADLHLVSSSGPVLRRLETIALPETWGGLDKGSPPCPAWDRPLFRVGSSGSELSVRKQQVFLSVVSGAIGAQSAPGAAGCAWVAHRACHRACTGQGSGRHAQAAAATQRRAPGGGCGHSRARRCSLRRRHQAPPHSLRFFAGVHPMH